MAWVTAVAQIPFLAWELPYAVGAVTKGKKKKKGFGDWNWPFPKLETWSYCDTQICERLDEGRETAGTH